MKHDEWDHSFFVGNTKKEFEPVVPWQKLKDGRQIYVMVEYAWINCKCGEVRKVVVKQGDNQ